MHVHRASPVKIFAPAKLNLFLEVLGKRTDGFHEIETLMVPVSLCDALAFQSTPDGPIDCTCRWCYARPIHKQAARPVPTLGDNNLAVRAARLLREAAGIDAGAHIDLVKRVPLEAGLAGGSSDAAAALVAANIGWNLNWPIARLSEVASQLGSDVAFFLAGGVALCSGRGEKVHVEADLAPLHFVIVQPPAGLSTAEVYRHCRPAETPCRADALVAAWRRGNGAAMGRLLHNRLEPAAAGLSPWIARVRDEFKRLDFLGSQMTGSGSAYFGLCRHARHARRLAAALRNRGFAQVFAVAGPQ
ncbi:MAG TPA: 4-(cytidine 5'-diphospho)-2-C-methyl-D-erythritol kinase [Pirellulales bacterium]|nr:4-(cytidine 5'-diphospho)-2-C-methyl-D-erythritol kinase [Pirellulales bacterium]